MEPEIVVSLDPTSQWDESQSLVLEEEESPEGHHHLFLPLGTRSKGLRRSLNNSSTASHGGSTASLDLPRAASAPPIEFQHLSHLLQHFSTNNSGGEELVLLSRDDPRRDPGYATFFHQNRRMDPRLPPPIYAPGQSWQQIWSAPRDTNSSATNVMLASSSSSVERLQFIDEGLEPSDEEFEELQQEIVTSSAGSSSSSSPKQPSSNSHRKRLVDMIQEDFPRTPSPVYPRLQSLSTSVMSNVATVGSSTGAGQPGSGPDEFLNFQMEGLSVLDQGGEAVVQMPRSGLAGRVHSADFHSTQFQSQYHNQYQSQYQGEFHQRQSVYMAPVPQASVLRQPPQGVRFGRNVSMPSHNMPPPLQPLAPPVQGLRQRPQDSHPQLQQRMTPSEALADEIRSGFSGRNKHIELAQLTGQLVVLSKDQHGSRFIQQRLELASPADRERCFQELLPHALALMTDVFGNYVIQKFFEYGSPVQQDTLCTVMKGSVLQLALQMYGCRVVQKALEHGTGHCRMLLCQELEGSVMRCVKDQNGNHVIQKCIECVPTESAPFLAASFAGQVYALATHPYGCRVIQRFFEHAPPQYSRPLIDELLRFTDNLVRDQYGNYVVQHLIERGEPADREQIISRIRGSILELSRHKFASNVVEKAVQFSNRQGFLEELLAPMLQLNIETGLQEETFPLLLMMKDQFANYVVQKMLDLLDRNQRDLLLERMKPHLPALRKYTYGKHIIAKVDKLLAEQQQQPSPRRS